MKLFNIRIFIYLYNYYRFIASIREDTNDPLYEGDELNFEFDFR